MCHAHRQAVVVREIESDDGDDDDDDTSSSDDGDEELRARRARDREIQRAKAQKINKPSGVMDRPSPPTSTTALQDRCCMQSDPCSTSGIDACQWLWMLGCAC